MRLGDEERERLIELLGRHAAEGRLSVTDLEQRIETVARALTREDAEAALRDLPRLAPLAAPGPRRRGRRHGETDAPAADWQATAERFRDPRSGRVMRVWVDAGGGRHYVPDG